MPVLNNLSFTQNAIASIESNVDYHVVLIDQASDDGTREWGKSKQSDNFTYIENNPRISLAGAWNQGVRKALEDNDCKYIAILNNDIILHPKTLNHLMSFMDKTNYILVTADNIKDRMSIETMLQMELPMAFTDYDCEQINDWRAEGPDFSCFMVSRDFVDIIGWFDENYKGAYCEDWDTHVRIRRAYTHNRQHNDLNVPVERIHAKRLSTAPYYHFASQTIVNNSNIRVEISAQHARNQAYYASKWGGDHPYCMDDNGNVQPFGDATKNWRNW